MFLYGGTNPFPRAVSSALEFNRACTNLRALANVSPFAVVHATVSGTATITKYYGMNGNGLAHAPAIERRAAGYTRLIWQPTYEDVYGIRWPIDLTCGKGTAEEITSAVVSVIPLVSKFTNVVDVRTYDPITKAMADCNYVARFW